MNLLRRLGIWALITVFFSSLLLLAYGWMFNETFGNRETVKSWFDKSGTYDNFVEEIVALSQAQAAEEGNTIDTTTLTEAATNSFTPDRLQAALETVLDASYDWLEGSESDITFEVDFTQAKREYADNLTVYAQERVAKLPLCEPNAITAAFDPFTAPCQPAQLDFEPLADDFRQLIYDDENFLPNPVLTAQNLEVDDDGQKRQLSEALSFMPLAYTIARLTTVFALIGAVFSAALLLGIASSKRKAVFKFFRGFAFTALSLALFTFVSTRSTDWIDSVLSIDPTAQGFTESVVKPLVNTASQDLTVWTFRFMVIYAAIAAGIFAIWWYLYQSRRKKPVFKRTKESMKKLELAYRKRVSKSPRVYKKSYTKRKEALRKKHRTRHTRNK